MKKVIFVCLLSLSVCLSQPNAPAAAAPVKPPVTQPTAEATLTKGNETNTDHPQAAAVTPTTVLTPAGQNATANVTQTSNETSTKIINDTKPTEKTAPTNTTSSTIAPAKSVDPAKGNNETKPGPVVPGNGTNADSKDNKKNETTTTPKGENVSPTATPVEAKSRAFDGPSFIGGIILTLGLLAIGFMGFKYYKNQTERNYHTL